jgi:hypothetical protein
VVLAATVLTDTAEGRDLVMHARIALTRALNRNRAEAEPARQRKAAKVYRVVR